MGFSNEKFKQVSKLFFVWQDEKEERWLRKMALEGWHLVGIKGLTKYQFIKGEPQDYYYKLDFKNKQMDHDDYVGIFEAAGWEYVGNMMLWHYFRKLGMDGQMPEIYTDNQSKVDRNKRILVMLYSILGLNLFAGGFNLLNYFMGGYDINLKVSFLSILAVCLLAYAVYKIREKNKMLSEEI